jgi:hypothetical protein
MAKVYKDTVGLQIVITFDVSIAGAADITMEVLKPGASASESWSASLGADNQSITYTTVSGDLNVIGDYRINPKFTLGSWTGMTDKVEFEVYDQGA